jgi:hypothetical protein
VQRACLGLLVHMDGSTALMHRTTQIARLQASGVHAPHHRAAAGAVADLKRAHDRALGVAWSVRLLTFPEVRPAAKSVGKEPATRPAASSSAVTAGSWLPSPAQQRDRLMICCCMLLLGPAVVGTTHPCHPRHLLHHRRPRCCRYSCRCCRHHLPPAQSLRKKSCWLCTSGLQCGSVKVL